MKQEDCFETEAKKEAVNGVRQVLSSIGTHDERAKRKQERMLQQHCCCLALLDATQCVCLAFFFYRLHRRLSCLYFKIVSDTG